MKICENCGKPFTREEARGNRKFCSQSCYHEHDRGNVRVPPVTLNCKQCGKTFTRGQAELRAYRKKWGRDQLYCSIPCSALGRKADTAARSHFTCIQCGKINPMKQYGGGKRNGVPRTVYYRQQKFCDTQCKSDWQKTQFVQRFDAGDLTTRVKRGYVVVRIPTEPGKPRREMLLHRYVMEQHLGRPLRPDETVHHRIGKAHNEIENLELRSGHHGPGHAVVDQIAWAIERIRLYPEFAKAAGVMLVDLTHQAETS